MSLFLLQISFAAETIILDDNTAYAQASETIISIDKFKANNNEEVTIQLESTQPQTQICFELPVHNSLVQVSEIMIDGFWFFDTDLLNMESREDNKICYEISLTYSDIKFKAEYLGQGEIKYNITLSDGTVLDPYLVGDLATSNQLVSYFPFDGNSSNVWAKQSNALSTSGLRFNETKFDTATSGGSWTDSSFAFDNNWATKAYRNYVGGDYAYLYYSIARTANDTGGNLQVKNGYSGGSWGTVTQTLNLSLIHI